MWAQPTPPPTNAPTPIPVIKTIHPIQIKLMNVPDDYTIGAELRSSILRLVFTKLEEFVLDIIGLDLVSVEYAGRLRPKDRRMLMQSSSLLRLHPSHRQLVKQLSIPLGITVLGNKDISDFSLSFLMEAMRSKVLSALIIYLKENAGLPDGTIMIADVFDFKDILPDDSTNPPTSKPSPMRESSSTSSPSVRVVVAQSSEGENDTTTTIWTIWWVWSLIGLAVLAILLCLCCCILRKSKKNEKKSTTEEQDPAMIAWMKTGSTGSSLSKGNAQVIFGLQQEKRYQKRQSQRYDYDTGNHDDMFLGQSMGIIRRSESSRHYEEDRQHHRRNSRQRSKPKPKRRRQAEQSLKKKKRRRRNRSKRQDESRSQKLVGQQLLLEEEGQKESSTLLQIETEQYESRALVPYTQNENSNENVAGVELVPHTTKPRRRASIDPEGSSASLAYAELSAADIIRQSVLVDEKTKEEDDAYSVILSGLQSSADDALAKKKDLPKYVKTKSNRKDDEDCAVIFCHDNTDEPSVVTNHV